MSEDPAPPPEPVTGTNSAAHRRLEWVLLAACLVPATLSLVNEVQEVDPAQYADVARRMLDGHWLALRDMSGPFVNKPPLMMWTQALCMAVLGVGSLAARLPALLFGLVATLATYLVGRELRGHTRGLLAAVLFSSSVAFHHMVADPKVDMPLTAMSALAVWALLAARRRPALVWLAWVLAALAVLSKGPVGLALTVMAVGPALLRRGGLLPEASLLHRLLWVRPVRGLLLLTAVVSPFFLATAREAGSGSLVTLLWTLGPGRLLGDTTWKDSTTPLYFVHTGLWALAPFSPLLIAALGRRLVTAARSPLRLPPPDAGRVPLWWFLGPFVAISLSGFKLPQYLYWLAPAGALLAAEELETLSTAAHRAWRAVFMGLAAAAAALVAALALFCFPGHWPWLGLVLAAPAAAWLGTARAPAAHRTAALAAASSLGFLTSFHAGLQPALLEFQPSREVAALVREVDPSGAFLPCFGTPPTSSLHFYARRDVIEVDLQGLRAAVATRRARVALVGDGQLEALREAGLHPRTLGRFATYHTSLPHLDFLLATRRDSVLGHVEVVALEP